MLGGAGTGKAMRGNARQCRERPGSALLGYASLGRARATNGSLEQFSGLFYCSKFFMLSEEKYLFFALLLLFTVIHEKPIHFSGLLTDLEW